VSSLFHPFSSRHKVKTIGVLLGVPQGVTLIKCGQCGTQLQIQAPAPRAAPPPRPVQNTVIIERNYRSGYPGYGMGVGGMALGMVSKKIVELQVFCKRVAPGATHAWLFKALWDSRSGHVLCRLFQSRNEHRRVLQQGGRNREQGKAYFCFYVNLISFL